MSSSAAHGAGVDITRDLWKPLNDNQIHDMLQELSDLIQSYPSCLEKETFEPLRQLIADAIHYPRKYLRTRKIVASAFVAQTLGAGTAATTTTTTTTEAAGTAAAASSQAAAGNSRSSRSSTTTTTGSNKRRRLPLLRGGEDEQEEEIVGAAVAAAAAVTAPHAARAAAHTTTHYSNTNTTNDSSSPYHYDSARAIFNATTSAVGGGGGGTAPHYNRQDELQPQQQPHYEEEVAAAPAGGPPPQPEPEPEQQQPKTNKKRKTLATRQSVNYMAENTLHEIPRVVCDKFTNDWNQRFDELEQYRIHNGHSNVPKSWQPNPALGRWVDRQRQQYQLWRSGRKTQLTQDRAERLTSLGFVWDAQQASWDTKLKELEEYKNRHGDCNVPMKHKDKDTTSLSGWITSQRSAKKDLDNGRPSSMTPSRIKALDDLGFNWGKSHIPFDARVKQVEEYKKQNGDADVPRTCPADQSLSNWVKYMRAEYAKFMDGQKSILDQGRIDQLNGVDFCWEGKDKWDRKFDQLKAYRNLWGVCNVPYAWPENKALGAWIRFQRKQKQLFDEGNKDTCLTQSRIMALEEIGFNFQEGHEKNWDYKFEELKSFHSFFGHSNVPENHPSLWKFVKSQRVAYHKYYKKGKKPNLTDARVEELNSIDFCWGEDEENGTGKQPPGSDKDKGQKRGSRKSGKKNDKQKATGADSNKKKAQPNKRKSNRASAKPPPAAAINEGKSDGENDKSDKDSTDEQPPGSDNKKDDSYASAHV